MFMNDSLYRKVELVIVLIFLGFIGVILVQRNNIKSLNIELEKTREVCKVQADAINKPKLVEKPKIVYRIIERKVEVNGTKSETVKEVISSQGKESAPEVPEMAQNSPKTTVNPYRIAVGYNIRYNCFSVEFDTIVGNLLGMPVDVGIGVGNSLTLSAGLRF